MSVVTKEVYKGLSENYWYGFSPCAFEGSHKALKAEYPSKDSLPKTVSSLGDELPVEWYDKSELRVVDSTKYNEITTPLFEVLKRLREVAFLPENSDERYDKLRSVLSKSEDKEIYQKLLNWYNQGMALPESEKFKHLSRQPLRFDGTTLRLKCQGTTYFYQLDYGTVIGSSS